MKHHATCVYIILTLYIPFLTCSDHFPKNVSHRSRQRLPGTSEDQLFLGRLIQEKIAAEEQRDHLASELNRAEHHISAIHTDGLWLRHTIDTLHTEKAEAISQNQNLKKEHAEALQKIAALELEKKNILSQLETSETASGEYHLSIARLCYAWSEHQRRQITTTQTSPVPISQVTAQERKTPTQPDKRQPRKRDRRSRRAHNHTS